MTKKDILAIAQSASKIENNNDRKAFVQSILPYLYQNGPKSFNAISFCLDARVPALIG